MRRYLLTIGIAVSACGPSPFSVDGSERRDPPEIFREWYAEAEACRGLRGDFDRVTWYFVPDVEGRVDELGGIEGAIGLWRPPHSIYLLDCCWLDEATVKHESLHDILSYHFGTRPENIAHGDSLSFYGEEACDTSP